MPSMSEEELLFAGSPLDRVPMLSATTVPPERRAQQGRENLLTLMGMLPFIGNAMSAYDATQTGAAALDDFSAGDTRSGLINTGLTGVNALGAFLGLPVGKTAASVAKAGKDTASVFIPAVDDAATDAARELREGSAKPSTIHRKTQRVLTPEGKFLEEIPDRDMKLDYDLMKPGRHTTLSKFADHPKLFDIHPQFRDIPVEFGGDIPGRAPLMTASTKPDGTLLLPINNDVKGNVAKLLQYRLSDAYNLAPSVRHSMEGGREAFAKSAEKAATVSPGNINDLEALAAYTQAIQGVQGKADDFLAKGHTKKAAQLFGEVSAGNVLAHRARIRADATDHGLKSSPHVFHDVNFSEIVPLIPENASPDQVRQFLLDWRTLGSGRTPSPTSNKEAGMRLLKALNALEGK